MKVYLIKYLNFIIILLLGSLIVVSANTWFGMWVGLEMNMLGFIFMIKNGSMENSMKYFLVQSMASSLFMVLIFYYSKMIYLPLLLKMGCAPFHVWSTQMAIGLNWDLLLILLTLQKMAPLIILNLVNNEAIYLFGVFTILVGSLLGCSSTRVKLLLVYSSVSNLGWMMISNSWWLLFFMVYSMGLINTIYYMNKMTYISWVPNKMVVMMNLLSLAGFPPFIGFVPKLLILLESNNFLLGLLMVLPSAFIIYFYFSIINSTSMAPSCASKKWSEFSLLKNNFGVVWPMAGLLCCFMLPL